MSAQLSRRAFLAIAAAAGLVVTNPAAIAARRSRSLGVLAFRTPQFERTTMVFGYGSQIGIQVSYVTGVVTPTRYRHAARVPTDAWENMSAAQREDLWRMLEDRCLEMAHKEHV